MRKIGPSSFTRNGNPLLCKALDKTKLGLKIDLPLTPCRARKLVPEKLFNRESFASHRLTAWQRVGSVQGQANFILNAAEL